jgi:hypothetical protein
MMSDEREKIRKIAYRAMSDWDLKEVTVIMDLNMALLRNSIDLEQLLHSDNRTFTHDIGGINKHLNRETGELKGFHPICAKQQ